MRTLTLAIMAFTVGCKSETDINDNNTEETPEEIRNEAGLIYMTDCAFADNADFTRIDTPYQLNVGIDTVDCALDAPIDGVYVWYDSSLNGEMTFTESWEEIDGLQWLTGADAAYTFPYPPVAGFTVQVFPYQGDLALGRLFIGINCTGGEEIGESCNVDW